ncbi:MAG TPA: maltodextrin phosphorylase, partial [Erwinia sp.]|nr:maltodextrin phosphorylase [Erwinia sp.]
MQATFNKTTFMAALARQCAPYQAQDMTQHQWWQAVSAALAEQLHALPAVAPSGQQRHVNYISMEFLIGRLTANNLINLGWLEEVSEILKKQGVNLTDVLEQ